MKFYSVKKGFTLLLAWALLLGITACGDSDSAKTKGSSQNFQDLIGTWQQTAVGDQPVSGITVKLIFDERTLTMDAPGCRIIGDYAATGDAFTYTVTSVKGDACARNQKIGESDRVYYRIFDDTLYLKLDSAGEQGQTAYRRIKEEQRS
jgi:hypothetical protein